MHPNCFCSYTCDNPSPGIGGSCDAPVVNIVNIVIVIVIVIINNNNNQ
jgi:hypothetical protein